jgi:hypothetical protein
MATPQWITLIAALGVGSIDFGKPAQARRQRPQETTAVGWVATGSVVVAWGARDRTNASQGVPSVAPRLGHFGGRFFSRPTTLTTVGSRALSLRA